VVCAGPGKLLNCNDTTDADTDCGTGFQQFGKISNDV
jgi:hypothetical protein